MDLEPPDARTTLFREGLSRLRRLTGKPDASARSLLGRMLRDAGDDCALLGAVLHDAEATRPADPVAWIARTLEVRTGRAAGTGPPRDDAHARRSAAFDALMELTQGPPQ